MVGITIIQAAQAVKQHVNGLTGELLFNADNHVSTNIATPITADGTPGTIKYTDISFQGSDQVSIPASTGDYSVPFSEVSAERKTGTAPNGTTINRDHYKMKDNTTLTVITDGQYFITETYKPDDGSSHFTYGETKPGAKKEPSFTVTQEGSDTDIFISVDGDKKPYTSGQPLYQLFTNIPVPAEWIDLLKTPTKWEMDSGGVLRAYFPLLSKEADDFTSVSENKMGMQPSIEFTATEIALVFEGADAARVKTIG